MLIELKNINKTYITKTGVSFRALSNVSVTFEETGLVFLLGKSGSGKSTLLNILGALDSFDSGEMWVGNRMLNRVNSNALDYYRNSLVGFVFQEFNLIESLSALDNVKLALGIKGERKQGTNSHTVRAKELLNRFGIENNVKAKVRNLSGGQKQRVAIARALIKEPKLILADEPTGALDSVTGEEIIQTLKQISKSKLVIVVTHDALMAAKYGDRILEMQDGNIYRDVQKRNLNPIGSSFGVGEGIEMIAQTLVRLEPGVKIDEETVAQINGIVTDGGRKSFLNIDSDAPKVKALFPHLREAVSATSESKIMDSAKTQAVQNAENATDREDFFVKTDALLQGNDFVPYKSVPTPKIDVTFARSKMSIPSTIKMALHNLRVKKFRLALILLVTVFAFLLLGLSNTLSNVTTERSLTKSIVHDNVKAVSVSNITQYSNASNRISDKSIQRLQDRHTQRKFYKQFISPLPVQGKYSASLANLKGYRFTSFSGVTLIDDVTKLNFPILFGTSSPTGAKDVVISSYAASALIAGGCFNDKTLQIYDVLGKTLTFQEDYYVIVGIVETDYKPYKNKYGLQEDDLYHAAFMLFAGQNAGFFEEMATLAERKGVHIEGDLNGRNMKMWQDDSMFVYEGSRQFYDSNKLQVVTSGIDLSQSAGKKGIVIFLQYDLDREYLDEASQFNCSENAYIRLGEKIPGNALRSKFILNSNQYYIKGFVAPNQQIRGGLLLEPDTYNQYIHAGMQPSNYLISIDGSERETLKLIQDLYGNSLQVNASYNSLLVLYLGVFKNFEGLVTAATVGLSALSVLLMYNFIATSIRQTKHTIGLLRALGVKKINSFMVYVTEGFAIAAATFLLAIIALLILIPVINNMLSVTFGAYMALMTIHPLAILSMAALAFGVAVVAVFIPWFKFTKMSPADALNAQK